MRHRVVRELLYDYLQTGMDEQLRRGIEDHLAACRSCSRDLGAIKVVLGALPHEGEHREPGRTQDQWDALHASIMQGIRKENATAHRFQWSGSWAALTGRRPAFAIAAGAAAALLVLFWFFRTPVEEHPPAPRETVQSQDPAELGRYLRKSRVLLTGLSNLQPPAGTPVDISLEREVSRQLMIEGRSLREQKLDPRSDRRSGDLDRIMERVTSAPDHPPDIQTIRNDIRGQNLLVKLRVAETSYANTAAARRGSGL